MQPGYGWGGPGFGPGLAGLTGTFAADGRPRRENQGEIQVDIKPALN
jgi:hypothetical protein